MAPWYGNAFCITGPLWGESSQRASDTLIGQWCRALMFPLFFGQNSQVWSATPWCPCNVTVMRYVHRKNGYHISTKLQSNAVSHWQGANLESALHMFHTGLSAKLAAASQTVLHFSDVSVMESGWGLGAFLRCWPTSTMWAAHFNIFMDNPIFSNLGLCAVCWARFMCHYELGSTSVGHPFSFLNSSWGLTGGKHYQKITIALFRFALQNFTIPGYFPYIVFYSCLFCLLSSGLFVIAVCGSISVQATSLGLALL